MNEDAIYRKLVCAFIAGLISDDGEREKGLEYIRNMPAVNPQPCEDAISRQAVIDGINRYFHDEYYQRTSIQDCRDCLIEDVINELPPVNPTKTGWIPVSERLPDNYDRYLITTEDGRVEMAGYGYTDDLPNEIAFHEWDDEEWQCWKPNVIAWMPLPTPYEPQESEG